MSTREVGSERPYYLSLLLEDILLNRLASLFRIIAADPQDSQTKPVAENTRR